MSEYTPMETFWIQLKPYVVHLDTEIPYAVKVEVRAPVALIIRLGHFRKFEIIELDDPDDVPVMDWANASYIESASILRKVGILNS